MNYRRGLHRVFALACVLWALAVLVGFPIQAVNRNREFAWQSEAFATSHPAPDAASRIEHERSQRLLWQQATLQYVYRHEVLPHWPIVLATLVIPPLVAYGLIWLGISIMSWVIRGFRA